MGFIDAFKTGVSMAKRDAALERGEKDKAARAVIEAYNKCLKRSSSCQLKDCTTCRGRR